jgi:predicted PurR-regulated permease PerM
MTNLIPLHVSPKWSPTTKIVVGLTIVGAVMGLLIYFRSIIGPLLLAVILAYLLHPLAVYLTHFTRLSWRLIVTILYLLLLFLLIGVFTLSGLVIVQQIQNLIGVVQNFIQNEFPELLNNLSQQVYEIGPFRLEMSQFDLNFLTQQIIQTLEPFFGKLGMLVGTFATKAVTTIGFTLFILLISYFLLSGVGQMPDVLDYIKIPGYDTDIRRMGQEMGYIWNVFLRGQLVLVGLSAVIYAVVMTALGIRNWVLVIAILAGIHRLVPYIGATITWIVTAIITMLQGSNYFGLQPIAYTILIVAVALLVDNIFESIIPPFILGHALKIHPALLLIGALVAAKLLGLIGLFLTAPVIASLRLVGGYTIRKMLNMDPWQDFEARRQFVSVPESPIIQRLRIWWQTQRNRGKKDERF